MNILMLTIIPCMVTGFNFRGWMMTKYIPKHSTQDEWWNNSVIHSFGNTGVGGKFHAHLAPHVTHMIDNKAYDGTNIRREISDHVVSKIQNRNSVIAMDFGCGVGISTKELDRSLGNKFQHHQVYGVDTSPEMIAKAREITPTSIIYVNDNAATSPLSHLAGKVDMITIYFLMHEAPRLGHYHVLESAHKLLRDQGIVVIADISMSYKPSLMMLLGEPYILHYQQTFEDTIDQVIKSTKFKQLKDDELFTEWIQDHVEVTVLRKDEGI